MQEVDAFIEQCQRIIHRHVDFAISGKSIQKAAGTLSHCVHPMIHKILLLAEDLAEDHRSDSDTQRADWQTICEMVESYHQGRWEPTIWSLLAIYRLSAQASVSIKISRQQGNITIETADNELRKLIEKTASTINSSQTDERFLQNLAHQLPHKTSHFCLLSGQVVETLIS